VSAARRPSAGAGAPAGPTPARVGAWLAERRWYAAGDEPPAVRAIERLELGASAATGPLAVALVDTEAGDRYQLVQADAAPDRADTPEVAAALAAWVAAGVAGPPAPGSGDRLVAHWIGGALGHRPARPLGAEQSNTSVAVGGTHVLKVLRRVRPGPHPEVEVGRHLVAVAEAGAAGPLDGDVLGAALVPVPRLAGWYELVPGDGGEPTVLGTVHELVAGALDGWELTLSALAADPDALLARLHDLGATVARLHAALAAPDPSADGFGAEPLAPARVAELAAADPRLEPLVEAVGTDTGAAIRTHGDLHLGQTLVAGDGWSVLDFEGEPARSLEERRAHQSPLRDVAGMLRSFAYAAAAHQRATGRRLSPGWEPAARAAFLDGYLATVPPALLPGSAAATRALTTLFEVEKATYELGYERAHRPDWVDIPAAGLARLLEGIPR
jgi:maltokinase